MVIVLSKDEFISDDYRLCFDLHLLIDNVFKKPDVHHGLL